MGRTDQQRIYLDQAHAPDSAQATDDVINHIIDAAQQHAANIVFIPADYLQSKAPLTLMSRYSVQQLSPFDCDLKNSHSDLSTRLFQSRFKLLIHTQIYAFS